jgi:hypothetical protein
LIEGDVQVEYNDLTEDTVSLISGKNDDDEDGGILHFSSLQQLNGETKPVVVEVGKTEVVGLLLIGINSDFIFSDFLNIWGEAEIISGGVGMGFTITFEPI